MKNREQAFSTAFAREILISLLAFFAIHASAQTGPSNLNISGILYQPSGDIVSQASVNFRLEIWDKGSTCILYSEDHLAQNLSNTKGAFSLAIGKGTSPTNFLESSSSFTTKLFENSGAVAGGWPNCPSGTTLNSGDERVVRISYDLGAGLVAMSPDVPIASSAFAMVADTLQGKRPTDFVQLKDDATYDLNQANVENVFSAVNYARLQQLLSPSAAIGFGSQRLTSVADPTAAQDAATKNYSDTRLAGQTIDLQDVAPGFGGGKVLTWDQAQSKWVAQAPTIAGSAGGDLTGTYPNPTIAANAIGTSKISNNAITSAKINSTGVAANRLLITDATTGATVTYATCANDEVLKYVTGTGWQCATVSSLSAVTSVAGKTGAVTLNALDISGLGTAAIHNVGVGATEIPQLNGSGKLANSVIPAFIGDVTGAIDANIVVALQGRPVASTAPNANEVLRWNGSQWEPQALTDNGITALTGDISASGNGSVAATLTNGVVTTPKMFANPGVNRLVATDNSSGGTLVPFVCNLNETMQWTAGGWACTTVNTLLGTQFIVDGGNARGANISIGTTDNFALTLKTNNSDRLTILNTGSIGIGMTNPTTLLDVNGVTNSTSLTIAGKNALYSSGGNLNINNTASAQGVQIYPGSSGAAAITVANGTGNVGIGTTSPGAKLDVSGSVRIADQSKYYLGSAGWFYIDSSSVSNKMNIFANNANITMDAVGGYIGIGTTNPTSHLQIGSTSDSSAHFLNLTNDGAATNGLGIYFSKTAGTQRYLAVGSSGALHLGANPASGANADLDSAAHMTITNGGSVGVGTTSPNRILEVAGPIRIQPKTLPSSPAAGDLAFDSTGNSLKFHNGTAWQTVGTSSATGDFMANGTVPMTGNIRLNNNWLSGDGGNEGVYVNSTGYVGLGSSTPNFRLTLDNDGGLMALGTLGSGTTLSTSGAGTRMFWYPRKAAFRAGQTSGTHFDDAQIGNNSAAFGLDVKASGDYSVALNNGSTASGFYSTATGRSTASGQYAVSLGNGNATGNYSLAGGTITYANGAYSTAFGTGSSADGQNSISVGNTTDAPTFAQATFGAFNIIQTGTAGSWVSSDPLFVIGNGTGSGARSTAVTVLKNGNFGIGTTASNRTLEVAGTMRLQPSTPPASPGAGDLTLDSGASNSLKYHNGSSWVTIGSGSGDFMKNGSVAMTGNLRLNNNWLSGDGGDEGIFVDSAGKVGIGTANPGAKLDVNGNVAVSGNVTLADGNTVTSRNFAGISGTYFKINPWLIFQNASDSSTILSINTSSNAIDVPGGNINLGSGSIITDGGSSLGNPAGAGRFNYLYGATKITPGISAGNVVLNVTGASGQTANFVEVNSDGTTGGDKFVITSSGNVGIGTSLPTRMLDVAGAIHVLPTANPGAGAAGDLFFDSAASNSLKYHNGTNWISVGAGSGDFMKDGSVAMTGNISLNGNWLSGDGGSEGVFVDSAGNAGIGTTSPAAKLDVAGEVKFGNTSSTCNATNEGQQRYNSISKKMEFCNGTLWADIGGASSSVFAKGRIYVQSTGATLVAGTNCSVSRLSTGAVQVTMTTAASSVNYIVIVKGARDANAVNSMAAEGSGYGSYPARSTTQFVVTLAPATTAAVTEPGYIDFVVYDQ